MIDENQLIRWTNPSSNAEAEKQNNTQKVIREAIDEHSSFSHIKSLIDVYPKGSYANNTNVKLDSDVDIVVEYKGFTYTSIYNSTVLTKPLATNTNSGYWSPQRFRNEVESALSKKFLGSLSTGNVAFQIASNYKTVNADVVPCFNFKYRYNNKIYEGTKIFPINGGSIENYPKLQLKLGVDKNVRTGRRYKKAVRILKNIENYLVENNLSEPMPSYLLECLVYNCPESYFEEKTWKNIMMNCIVSIALASNKNNQEWVEANGVKTLFDLNQKWSSSEVREFSGAVWNILE